MGIWEDGGRISSGGRGEAPNQSSAKGTGGWGVDGAPRPAEVAGSNPVGGGSCPRWSTV